MALLEHNTPEIRNGLAHMANVFRQKHFGNRIYIRGLIEFTNYCKNNCYYCGIRKDNKALERYRLSKEDILACCKQGYKLGFRTFVLQGGEDSHFTDSRLIDIITDIHNQYPDCAITLSLGERSKDSYNALYKAGASRYLLRHETADKEHYESLHPETMSYDNRLKCLQNLQQIGFQTGCGFMVGSPNQTYETIAKDLCYIQQFHPHMVGIGPFIAHHNTPFSEEKNGTLEDTLLIISLLRLIEPKLLIPSTTALGSIHPDGCKMGILAGANVIMPNLTPCSIREQYALYDNKISQGAETAEGLTTLKKQIKEIGFEIVTDIGDSPL